MICERPDSRQAWNQVFIESAPNMSPAATPAATMSCSSKLKLTSLTTLPEVRPEDRLATLIAEACERENVAWSSGSVAVIAQKIVSKAEGAIVDLRAVRPSARAESYARDHNKDARLVELVLQQSKRIVRMERGLIISETYHGFICANAGVDRSNVPGDHHATVLPKDPDASARAVRKGLRDYTGLDIGVVISDTFGRAWRLGLVNVAIGVAGFQPVEDLRGQTDRQGRPLHATSPAVADEIAAAAGLLMAKNAGRPVVIVEGLSIRAGEASAAQLVRRSEDDLFR